MSAPESDPARPVAPQENSPLPVPVQPEPAAIQPAAIQPTQIQPLQPYQAPQYPPQTYAQSGYTPYTAPAVMQPMYVVSQPKGFSVTALILGLASIVFGFTFLVPLGALIFGIIGAKKEPAGRGMAVTGIVIGALFMLFWLVFGGAIVALLFGLAGAAGTMTVQ